MRVCLLTAGVYPVPATEGGAVEGLVETLVRDYEKNDYECELTVISKGTKEACEAATKYKKTKFEFLKPTAFDTKIYPWFGRVFKKITGKQPTLKSDYIRKACGIIKREKYDVVVSENRPIFVSQLHGKVGSKLVIHLHNDTLNREIADSSHIVKDADMVLSVSDYISNRVQECNRSLTPIRTLRNVVSIERFRDEDKGVAKKKIRERYSIPEEALLFVFAGRLHPDKGLDKLVNAFLQTTTPNIYLMIVGGSAYADSGDTAYVKQIKERVAQSDGRIVMTGFVPYQNIAEYYMASDVAVFPSQWEEPAGMVVIEAQACGLPVIISDAGGMPEYVDANSGIIVNRGDGFVDELAMAMDSLAHDSEKRSAMGSAAFEKAACFGENGYFGRMLNMLSECKYGE